MIRTFLASLFILGAGILSPAHAALCVLSPYLQDLDAAAKAAVQHPDEAHVAQLERSLITLGQQLRLAGHAMVLDPKLIQYVRNRAALAAQYRLFGVDGLRQAAVRTAVQPNAIAALFKSMGCTPLAVSDALALSAIDGGDAASTQNGQNADEAGGDPETKPAPQRKNRQPMTGRSLIMQLPTPIIAIMVVIAIFGGLIYVMLRRKRRDTRYICYMPVTLGYQGQRSSTWLIELSRGGAKILSNTQANRGDALSINLDGHQLPARAMWSNASCVGVKFDSKLSKHEVFSRLGKGGGGFERHASA